VSGVLYVNGGNGYLSLINIINKYMTPEQQGALKRILEEVKEKRQYKCLNIDCPCNHQIGGNDIDLVEDLNTHNQLKELITLYKDTIKETEQEKENNENEDDYATGHIDAFESVVNDLTSLIK
jgi:hypothetical protein